MSNPLSDLRQDVATSPKSDQILRARLPVALPDGSQQHILLQAASGDDFSPHPPLLTLMAWECIQTHVPPVTVTSHADGWWVVMSVPYFYSQGFSIQFMPLSEPGPHASLEDAIDAYVRHLLACHARLADRIDYTVREAFEQEHADTIAAQKRHASAQEEVHAWLNAQATDAGLEVDLRGTAWKPEEPGKPWDVLCWSIDSLAAPDGCPDGHHIARETQTSIDFGQGKEADLLQNEPRVEVRDGHIVQETAGEGVLAAITRWRRPGDHIFIEQFTWDHDNACLRVSFGS